MSLGRVTGDCVSCGVTLTRYSALWRYCWECKARATRLCAAANRKVKRAITAGLLPDPSTLPCIDCGQTAREYDHRDYDYPLAVEAVCHGCNLRRGPAVSMLKRSAA